MGYSRDEKKMHYGKASPPAKRKGVSGLRSLDKLDQALVAKLAWGFLHDPDSIWGRLLKSKYLLDNCFWSAKKKNSKLFKYLE